MTAVNQIDRGFSSIFPFRNGFKNLVLKLIARLFDNWLRLGRSLAPFSPFVLFALFPLFFFSFRILKTSLFTRFFLSFRSTDRPCALLRVLTCFGPFSVPFFGPFFWPFSWPFFGPLFEPLLGFLLLLISGQPVNTQSKNMSTISLVFVLPKETNFLIKSGLTSGVEHALGATGIIFYKIKTYKWQGCLCEPLLVAAHGTWVPVPPYLKVNVRGRQVSPL
jgi:hypothetical protein